MSLKVINGFQIATNIDIGRLEPTTTGPSKSIPTVKSEAEDKAPKKKE